MSEDAEMQKTTPGIGRRPFIGGTAAALAAIITGARPADAQSAARKGTLVIALDISDAISLDPARVAQYSNPLPATPRTTAW